MAYRNGTYVAFHAAGTNQPGKSDIDYYNLLKAWTAKTDDDFTMINSHEKAFCRAGHKYAHHSAPFAP